MFVCSCKIHHPKGTYNQRLTQWLPKSTVFMSLATGYLTATNSRPCRGFGVLGAFKPDHHVCLTKLLPTRFKQHFQHFLKTDSEKTLFCRAVQTTWEFLFQMLETEWAGYRRQQLAARNLIIIFQNPLCTRCRIFSKRAHLGLGGHCRVEIIISISCHCLCATYAVVWGPECGWDWCYMQGTGWRCVRSV